MLTVRRSPRVHKRTPHLLKCSHKTPVSSAHPSRPAPDSTAPFICSCRLCLIVILSIIYLRLRILSLCSSPLPAQRGVHARHEGPNHLVMLNGGGSPCNDSTKEVKRATDAQCIHNMITGTHWGVLQCFIPTFAAASHQDHFSGEAQVLSNLYFSAVCQQV